MTRAGRRERAAAPLAAPHGPVSTALRLVLGIAGLAVITIPYFLTCVVLLPWRILRVRLGNLAGSLVGRWVCLVVGLSYELSGPPVKDLAPALFVQNHSGSLDLFLAMQICPWPCSGTLKREILRIPFIGLAYSLSGHLLIDRSDRERSIRSMDAIAELVRLHAISVWILPEGTRTRDGRLQPFKKGFGHIAMATGLPIVPVVVHDGHRFWSRGLRVRPGCVRVEVLPPIPTADWTPESLPQHIAELEGAFAEALAEHQKPISS
jgi:1-acyl-sn-glycerol-3-phosphate acyltransferase